jgi:hypothetical protein
MRHNVREKPVVLNENMSCAASKDIDKTSALPVWSPGGRKPDEKSNYETVFGGSSARA